MLKISEYQTRARETAIYTGINSGQYLVSYPFCGLVGECGELIDILNEYNEQLDKDKIITKDDVIKEAGDCCWYIANLATDIGVRFEKSDLLRAEITYINIVDTNYLRKLLVELGKIGEATKKLMRDNNQDKIELIKNGLLVVLYWIRNVLAKFNCSLEECFQINYDKLKNRQARNKLKGDGDNR